MVAQEITKLRKSGKLKEAYELAKQELSKDSDNIWNKRAMAWVQYELLKNAIERNEPRSVPKILIYIQKLNMPEDEDILFESIAWQVGKIVYQLNKGEENNYRLVNEIFDCIKRYHFPKPSESYSFLYKAFHKGYNNWSRYIEFAQWWDFDNFNPEDYQEETLDNGRKIMALVEQAYIAYSKKSLEGISGNSFSTHENETYEILIEAFLPKLQYIIKQYPLYTYPLYYYAKLLLELDKKQQAYDAVLPFVREKKHESWVWTVLAEAATDFNKKIGSLSKALLCNSGPEYLLKVREMMADLLIHKDMLPEAKTEIENILKTRNENDWKIPAQVQNWIQSEWYEQTRPLENNQKLYQKWAPVADKILFETVPTQKVIVDYVNREKKILNFIDKDRSTGFFNYSKELDKVSVGDVVEVRFNDKDGAYHTVHTAEIIPEEPITLIKKFSGSCNLIDGKGFGFVDDIFLSPDYVQKNNLTDGQDIQGRAMPSFDKNKKKWGWQAIKLEGD